MLPWLMLLGQENNVERAADWVFSHADELDSESMDTGPDTPSPNYMDGPGSEYIVI